MVPLPTQNTRLTLPFVAFPLRNRPRYRWVTDLFASRAAARTLTPPRDSQGTARKIQHYGAKSATVPQWEGSRAGGEVKILTHPTPITCNIYLPLYIDSRVLAEMVRPVRPFLPPPPFPDHCATSSFDSRPPSRPITSRLTILSSNRLLPPTLFKNAVN
ncbi:hypothetical protein E2C01_022852 [Portunus trituberculatus]|uniref:Uncharacterized protein n=1 Tax=Portunus trituberculatus TaxID=210409 RepID=A0A5B7E6I6_PORTR|nr:hypothetical protein [Portunus trituberculatus]